MALRKQLLEVPLSAGLAQKSDNRLAQPPEALTMQNLVRLKTGALRKRFGNTALSRISNEGVATTQKSGGALWSTGGALCMTGGNTLPAGAGTATPYTLVSFSDDLAVWSQAGRYPAADVLDRKLLAAFTSNPTDFDVVIGTNGVLVLAAMVDSVIYWAAYDGSGSNPTFAIIAAISTHLFTGNGGVGLRLIACGTTAILTYVHDANTVYCQSLDLTNPYNGWSAATALTLAGGQGASLASGIYDISEIVGDTTRFAMVFEKSATNSVALAIYSTTSPFTQSTLTSFEPIANFNTMAAMCVQATNNGYYWVGYVATAGASVSGVAGVARVNSYKESGAVTGTPATFGNFATGITIGKCGTCVTGTTALQAFLFGTGYASSTTGATTGFILAGTGKDTAGVTSAPFTVATHGLQLASRPIREDRLDFTSVGGIVAAVYTPSAVQGTHYTLVYDNIFNAIVPRPLSCVAPRLSKNMAQHFQAGANTNLQRNFNMPSALGSGEVYAFGMNLATETFHRAIAMQFVELAPAKTPIASDNKGQTLLAASMPFQFDGQFVMEPNFLSYPEIGTPAASTTGGSMAAGTYQYIVVWEGYDALGNKHESATSVAATAVIASGTTGSVSLTIMAPPLSYRHDQLVFTGNNAGAQTPLPRAVIYRTTAGGTTFYRSTADPAPQANELTPSATPVTIVDTQSDASLTAAATAQLLYTTGGVLDHFNPPAARCIVLHKGRWFLAGCDEPSQIWPSDPFISGICPGWNEAISFLATGAVRALASMDDKLIIFVQRGQAYGIEYVTGDGPTNLGTQSDWSPPQQVQSDTGAVDQRGTCATPLGILFRSTVGGPNGTGGIFLLGRDLTVQYLSGPVEDTLAANPVVTSMVLHPNAGRVYITCVQSDFALPLVGVRIVWDYIQHAFSVDTLSDPDNAQVGTAGARAACIGQTVNGPTYHWLTATGRVYRETNGIGSNAYTDAGTWVTAKYVSAWLKPAIAGFARFWGVEVLADQLDPADLTVQLTYDYAPSSYYQESHTWTAAQIATFDRAPQLNVHLTPGNQRAEAIQVSLTDATPTGLSATTGQGASWSTISLELGVKDGAYRNIPPAQRA